MQQSLGMQRVGHNLATKQQKQTYFFILPPIPRKGVYKLDNRKALTVTSTAQNTFK